LSFKLTKTQLDKLINNKDNALWHAELSKILPKYNIDTVERVAGFIAQTGHESGDFRIMSENLNYSAGGLNRVFSKYFRRAGRDAAAYARQPERIANIVYANRMSNGGADSNDGWTFRGAGILQLTGRDNHTRFGSSINITAEEAADYSRTVAGAIESACWFWNKNNLNRLCDRRDIVGMSKRINGGTNGLTDRVNRWNKALSVLNNEKNFELIRLGSTGDSVKVVQKKLGLEITGIFDKAMLLTVIKWQNANKLVDDGIVGPNTYRVMFG